MITRRKLLVGGGIGAGLILGWGIWPRKYMPNLPLAEGEVLFNNWLKIGKDGQVTIAIAQSEMGQGVYTQMAQILAGELGADWRTIAVQPISGNPEFSNMRVAKKWASALLPPSTVQDPNLVDDIDEDGPMINAMAQLAKRGSFIVTAESSSIQQFEMPLRMAGAAARVMLAQVAADKWKIDWESCEVEGGFVIYEKKKLSFGELAEAAAQLDPPSPVPLRASPINEISGQMVERLDLPSKVDGSANFAGDIRLPGMVYAAVRAGPIGNSRLKSFNKKGAAKISGLLKTISTNNFLAVVARNSWAANSALDALAPVFESKGRLADNAHIQKALDKAMSKKPGDDGGWQYYAKGKIADVFAKEAGTRIIAAEYQISPALHAALEPRSATAHFVDGKLHLWIASQAIENARELAAKAIGISTKNVVIYPMLAGGSFGRNLDNRIAAQIAIIAHEISVPVQLTWSRVEDIIRDYPRTPAKAQMRGALDKDGLVRGLTARIAVPAAARQQIRHLVYDNDYAQMMEDQNHFDPLSMEGMISPYKIDNMAIDHFPACVHVPTGNWRGNSHNIACFVNESFVDEMAHAAGVEPLSFRMQMMEGQLRLAKCLTEVAKIAGWDGGISADGGTASGTPAGGGSGMGIACHHMHGSYIALVVKATRGERGVEVDSVSAMVDCGRLIHPEIARQQIEGGIVFGLAQAIGGSTDYSEGLPDVRRLRELNLPLLRNIPEIQVEFVRSEEDPGGVGELATPVVAPAIANALFSASGLRLRDLPLLSTGF
ncbi:hypothetical protein LPB140_04065 [Sphingorhabdus lutea]|uniref:Aldehyde oxidase/xanthine dehydrogenase a/b hammerhead domain-containing protein n=1 Tax=Sphingorhabdus lutea TaxID=1913578 RepID=A0A1L3JEN9_9SPHN|nr:hypothetical protein LPB140_04065 [Sphingorhabdus lutea]